VTDQTEPEQPETQEHDQASATGSADDRRTRTRRRSRSGGSRDGGGSVGTSGGEPAGDASRGRRADADPAEASGERGEADDGAPGDDETGEQDGPSSGEGKRRRRRGRRGRGGRGRGRGRGRGADGEEATGAPDDEGEAIEPAPSDEDTPSEPAEAARARDDRPSGKAKGGDGDGKGGKGKGGDGKGKGGNGNGNGDGNGRNGKGKGNGRKDAGRSDAKDAKDTKDTKDTKDGESDEAAVEAAIAKGGTRVAAKRGRRGGGGNGRGRQQRPGGVPEEVRRAILEGPPRTMLVTSREDRTQIAVLEDRTVVEHYVTRKEDVTYVGNIYMARVQNVLPGMEAAFLDIGKGRNGVLYAGEVLYDELDLEEGEDERIENALKPGQKVLVQVTKDPMGSKGPRLTMHLSLAGRYMVLAPNSDLFGISRKLTDRERDRLRKAVKKVKPSEHGVIVRTAAEGATDEQITADLERLLAKWQRVEDAAAEAKALTTVYEEPPLVVKVIRDNFGPEFERCIVDDEDLYRQVRDYLDEVAPELLEKVELYGQPTTDARAKAVGAPSADGASAADDAPADATGEGTDERDPAGGAGGEIAAADAEADRAAVEQATTEGDGADASGGTADAAGGSGEDADGTGASPTSVGGLSTAELEAARARREELPPLFDAYDVADQLRKAMSKKVWLPSGGYLIIETTEAMKVIDVNTGKFTGNGDTNLEEVVLKTNLEAADEIVRQLRLRDMGGIIIIDFIDMLLRSNQDQVVRRLKRELLRDRTKTRVSEVSKLGLVQMTRKNVSQGLVESFSHTCKECEGRGIISELG
jgi:Ribonuclease G/E